MLRNEASIRELFYRPYTTDRSFVPQDDRKIGYVIGSCKISRDSEGVWQAGEKLTKFLKLRKSRISYLSWVGTKCRDSEGEMTYKNKRLSC